jgi:hypothetical protein
MLTQQVAAQAVVVAVALLVQAELLAKDLLARQEFLQLPLAVAVALVQLVYGLQQQPLKVVVVAFHPTLLVLL